jgi:hypothetical protein
MISVHIQCISNLIDENTSKDMDPLMRKKYVVLRQEMESYSIIIWSCAQNKDTFGGRLVRKSNTLGYQYGAFLEA